MRPTGWRRPLVVLTAVCSLGGVSGIQPAVADPIVARSAELAVAPAAIVVLIDDATPAPAAAAAALAHDYRLHLVEGSHLAALETNCFTFALTAGDAVAPLLARLRHDGRVASAQRHLVHRVSGMPPKDPYFDLQMRTRQGGVSKILQRGSGRNVRIAIIDTGVDGEHPDLRGQLVEFRNFVGAETNVQPAEFHGTAVTGLIAARSGNGIGIHGIAPDAQIYALRGCWEPVYGYGLCSTNTLARALDYAIEVRARIINLSVAGPEDPLLTRLVERAVELGAVVFGAIGEEPGQSFPAGIRDVIAVEQNRRGDVEVPGERVTIPGQQLLTTVPGNRYDFVSGPSFATAHASGVAAVMLELQPHLKAHDLADWLRRLHDNG